MVNDIFAFTTCDDILATLSRLMKKRRLEKGHTRKSLQSITGVPAPTIARFETSSRISLESFVKLSKYQGNCRTASELQNQPLFHQMKDRNPFVLRRKGPEAVRRRAVR